MFHSTPQHNTSTTRFFFQNFTIYKKNNIKRIQNLHYRLVPLFLNIESNKTSQIRFSNHKTSFTFQKNPSHDIIWTYQPVLIHFFHLALRCNSKCFVENFVEILVEFFGLTYFCYYNFWVLLPKTTVICFLLRRVDPKTFLLFHCCHFLEKKISSHASHSTDHTYVPFQQNIRLYSS